MRSNKEHWEKTILVLGFFPLGFIISLLMFYFHAGFVLGHLPSYNFPDPKELSLYLIYHKIIIISTYIFLFSLAGWLTIILWYILNYRKNILWNALFLSAFIHISAIVLFCSDIFEWFMD